MIILAFYRALKFLLTFDFFKLLLLLKKSQLIYILGLLVIYFLSTLSIRFALKSLNYIIIYLLYYRFLYIFLIKQNIICIWSIFFSKINYFLRNNVNNILFFEIVFISCTVFMVRMKSISLPYFLIQRVRLKILKKGIPLKIFQQKIRFFYLIILPQLYQILTILRNLI